MAISTAAALIGSAVIGAGASYVSSKSAANKAKDAANYAADQNAAVSREIYQQTRSDLSPYNQAGQAGLAALMTRLGLSPGQAAAVGQPQVSAPGATANKATGGPAGVSPLEGALGSVGGTPSGVQPNWAPNPVNEYAPPGSPQAPTQPAGPDWNAYLQANPDVAAQAAREGRDPLEYAPAHYQAFGQKEGRELPMTQPQAATPAAPAVPPPTPAEEAAQFGTRPTDIARPQFGPTPNVGSYLDPSKFQVDPGYQFRLSEGLNAVNTASAARGLLRSGDAAKALQARGEGLANQGYNDWYQRQLQAYDRDYGSAIDQRSFDANWWNTQQGRQDNIFSEDRGFNRSVFDQNTSNLFGLVGVGQNAAAGTANAGNVFAQNQINSNNQRAATTANAAIANAQNMNNLFGSAAGAVGTYYGLRGGF